MSEELEKLRKAMLASDAVPDPAARAHALAAAMEGFDRNQERAAAARPIPDRPQGAGVAIGLRAMLNRLSSHAALAAGASAITLGLAFVLVGPGLNAPDLRRAPQPAPQVPVVDPAEAEKADPAEADDAQAPTSRPMMEPQSILPEALQGYSDPAMSRAPFPPGQAVMESSRMIAPAGDGTAPGFLPAPEQAETETYASADANPVKSVAEHPVSTFSIDVDTASYAIVRRFLAMGQLPPAQAVRIEEMVNYFPYDHAPPAPGGAPFRPTVTVTGTPWNPDTTLVHVAIQGRMPALEDRPPLNLVFLIDTSGSMQDADKLPLLKQSFRLLLNRLRPEDRVAIVTYAGSAGQVLQPTAADDRDTILAALDRLEAGGSTAGEAGLQQAYSVAEDMTEDGDVTRVILATDGDFNVGLSDPEALKDYIAGKRAGGTYLSVLGFGRGNLDDATMQALAQNGNGTAAYIDTATEARKVLSDQVAGALFPIADDVKVQVEFNPATVAEYRLIGYETRTLNREDFNDDRVDAGEIGAGHSVTALYEVTPVGSPARLIDPLRYEAPAPAAGAADEFGWLKLRYKDPGASASRLIELPIPSETSAAGPEVNFAIAIAGFGQLLTGARHLGDWGWDEAIALAQGARGDDPFNYRGEAVQLMRTARDLSR